MVQRMMSLGANVGRSEFVRLAVQSRDTAMFRKLAGLAIVGSGYAVFFAHGLQHAFG